jgi:hypothetical protein
MKTFLRIAAAAYCVALLSAVCAAAGGRSDSIGIIESAPSAQKKPSETYKMSTGKSQKFKQCTKCNESTKIDSSANRKTDSQKVPGTSTTPGGI